VFKNGTFYTTSFDLVNKYQGDVLLLEKFDTDKTFTALYWDADVKAFYVKRFSFVASDNMPLSFIAEGSKSYLVEISQDKHPQYEVIWKLTDKPSETVDAEQWIGKKGYAAKGKKVVDRGEVKKVHFVEPLHKPEDDIQETAAEDENIDLELGGDDVLTDIQAAVPEAAVSQAVVTGKVVSAQEVIDLELPEEPTLF